MFEFKTIKAKGYTARDLYYTKVRLSNYTGETIPILFKLKKLREGIEVYLRERDMATWASVTHTKWVIHSKISINDPTQFCL